MKRRQFFTQYLMTRLLVGAAALLLAACGGSGDGVVGGNVSGLVTGQTVSLQNNFKETITVSANGPFTFTTPVGPGNGYWVKVVAQPSGSTCVVPNGVGAIDLKGNAVNNITVTCGITSSVVGTVTGLIAGTTLTLSNGTTQYEVKSSGVTSLTGVLAAGSAYAVKIVAQPEGQTCTLTNDTGTTSATAVSNVGIACSVTSTLAGKVSGLASGGTLVLSNGSAQVNITANGPWSFPGLLTAGATYAVTVVTQPTGQTCTLSNASGTVTTLLLSYIAITCTP